MFRFHLFPLNLVLIYIACGLKSFHRFHIRSLAKTSFRESTHRFSTPSSFSAAAPFGDEKDKKIALGLLDCLTSPKNKDDPTYDVYKDLKRDNLISSIDYYELKMELKARGLRTTGDKLEMMTRILVHIIDPSIDYKEL